MFQVIDDFLTTVSLILSRLYIKPYYSIDSEEKTSFETGNAAPRRFMCLYGVREN